MSHRSAQRRRSPALDVDRGLGEERVVVYELVRCIPGVVGGLGG
jgi:hypothetical protein